MRMTVFAVEYTYDTARTDDLAAMRPRHREFLAGLVEAGSLVASGPWLDNAAPGALLLVLAEDVDGAPSGCWTRTPSTGRTSSPGAPPGRGTPSWAHCASTRRSSRPRLLLLGVPGQDLGDTRGGSLT